MNHFLIPEPRNRRSGGTLYDLQMVETLQGKGYEIKINWTDKNVGVKDIVSKLKRDDLLVIDGLVLHQNYKDANLLEDFEKIYILHLPFWLEPGINNIESEERKLRELNFMKKCKLVVCTSSFIRDIIIESGIPNKRIFVINPEVICQSELNRVYKKTPTEFLVVGSVHYGKGLDILIKALKKTENNSWKLKIAGDYNPNNSYFKEIKKLIDRSDLASKIDFLRECNKEQIEELYLNSDLLIHPSRFESYGMVVGEALCTGLPVLASDAGALPYVYKTTPVRFFKTEDLSSLTEMLRTILVPEGYQLLLKDFENYFFNTGREEYDHSIMGLIKYLK